MRPYPTFAALALAASMGVPSLAAHALPPVPAGAPYALADLGRYRTFGFFEPAQDGAGATAAPLTHEMKRATRAALEGRGYVYDATAPELRVNLLAVVVERRDLRARPAAHALAGRTRAEPMPYRLGTFAIDLVDARHHVLVWRGMARGALPPEAWLDPAGVIQAAVAGIFERFPAIAAPGAGREAP